ncbi:MAG TPA: hypothetical protein VGI56_14840, partial [Galbitalea sp.]
DPIGSYGVRPVTLLLSVVSVLVAAIGTLLTWRSVTDLGAAYLAVVQTGVLAIIVAFWSSPLRAPFSRLGFVVVALSELAVLVLFTAAVWGAPPTAFIQWAPVVIGLTIAQLAPYRPPKELVGMTIFGAIVSGFLTVLRLGVAPSHPPPLVLIVGSVVPLLAFGFGGAAFASALTRTLDRWFARSRSATGGVSDGVRESIVRSVQHDRVSILNDTVVPFFTDLLQRDRLDQDDRTRAQAIANSIRAVMVADVDRSWLDIVVDQVASQRDGIGTVGSEVVQDPQRLAAGMSAEQRTVMRALLLALFGHPGFDPDGFAIVLSSRGRFCNVVLTAKLDADESIPKSGLAAYFAVLRVAFADLRLRFHPPTLTLRFSYEHT